MSDALLAALTTHYKAIEALLDRADGLLAREEPDREELARLRWEEARALREYQLFKHMRIFTPAIAQGGAIAQLAQRLQAECVAAGETFKQHVVRWSGCAPSADWQGYRYAARSVSERVRRHISAERRSVELLLRMCADTPAPARVPALRV